MKGTIKKITDRGFGFIAPEDGGKDLFFHARDVQGVTFDDLHPNDAVVFEVVEGQKGPAAINITRA